MSPYKKTYYGARVEWAPGGKFRQASYGEWTDSESLARAQAAFIALTSYAGMDDVKIEIERSTARSICAWRRIGRVLAR